MIPLPEIIGREIMSSITEKARQVLVENSCPWVEPIFHFFSKGRDGGDQAVIKDTAVKTEVSESNSDGPPPPGLGGYDSRFDEDHLVQSNSDSRKTISYRHAAALPD